MLGSKSRGLPKGTVCNCLCRSLLHSTLPMILVIHEVGGIPNALQNRKEEKANCSSIVPLLIALAQIDGVIEPLLVNRVVKSLRGKLVEKSMDHVKDS